MWVSRRLFNTISFRLAALCALLFALILAVLLVFNYYATNHALEDQLRSRVQEEFNTLAEEVGGEHGDEVAREFDERLTRGSAPGSFFYLADAAGNKLAGNLDRVPMISGWQILPGPVAGKPEHEHAHEIWGEGTTLPNGLFIFAGQDAFRVNVAEHTLVMSYLWSGLFAGLAALVAGIVLSRGFLHRIDAINQTSLAIMQGNLKKRIPTRGTSDEVDRLSGNLNRLFDNNQALLDSLRQVTVNIAHDLRTPLSRLRNRLEEARDASRIPLRLREQLDGAIAESDQLLATFSALLRIAQIESGSRKKAFAKVNLSELGERVFAIYQAVAEDEGKKLSADITPEISCLGDGELLFQLCVNLVENAIRHTPKGTEITLRVSAPAKLEVADNGPGIPAKQREKVLERFYRLDQSRTTPGSGLGLALVAAIANLHNTRIELADNAPGLVARVRLQPN